MFKIVGKDVYDMKSEESKKLYAFAFVYEESDVEIPVKFSQTETLTTAFAGMTDYGSLFFNEANSDMEATVTIEAKDLRSESYGEKFETTVALSALVSMNVGDTF